MEFEKSSGDDLEAGLLRLRHRERALDVWILRGLIELDRRKLYLDRGCASLYAYCVERLGYCGSSAGRRIAVARAMSRIPRIEAMLLSGEARLSTVAMAAKELDRDESVLEEIRGKSQREVQEVLARRGASPRKRDSIQAVGEAWEFRFAAGRGSWRSSSGRGRCCRRSTPRRWRASRSSRRRSAPASEPSRRVHSPRGSGRRSRAIPVQVRRAVRRRDGGFY